jgi:RHS repeat-associated protein
VWQVYGPGGELLAEYPQQGAATVPTKEYGYRGGQLLVVFDSTEVAADDKLKWLVQDHLGSTRMIVNKSGSLVGIKRRDYLPFGEELAASVGHRAAGGSGYQVDDKPRQKFGSKERDSETGLDYFLARYYSSTQGRFTSPDEFNPILGKQGAEDKEAAEREFRQYLFQPARWNRYVYALNNPCRYIDPDGMDPITVNLNIIYDQGSNYTEEEKRRIRQTYIEQAKKKFGNIEVNFNITETTGTSSDIGSYQKQTITGGAAEGAVNVFFTKKEVDSRMFGTSEVTHYDKGAIFICTSRRNSDASDLTHGLIHAFGVATGVNGYSRAGAEITTLATEIRLRTGPIFYSDDRSPRREIVPSWAAAKVGIITYRTVPYERTTFDVLRDGARRYLKK